MNKKLVNIGGVVGILAIVFSLCSAVPKYESASPKRYDQCVILSDRSGQHSNAFLFSLTKCNARWK